MNILITGGAGYIGSHIAKYVSSIGHKPVVVDDLSRGHQEFVKWGPFFKIDLCETEALTSIMLREKIDAVIHCAALCYVGESFTRPLDYYQVNVGGTISLCEAMKLAGVDKIIFSSSCATYGVPNQIPILESTAQVPINPYGMSKLICEKIIKDCIGTYGFRAVILRYFNAAGASKDNDVGESHDPETHLIPLVISAGLLQGPPLKIFGNDYPTSDGTAVRDYIHVDDLAVGHALAVDWLASSVENRICELNLGTGMGSSNLEVIRSVEVELGTKIPFSVVERRQGDPPILVADASAAKKVLGWRAQSSSLAQIVHSASNWMKHVHKMSSSASSLRKVS